MFIPIPDVLRISMNHFNKENLNKNHPSNKAQFNVVSQIMSTKRGWPAVNLKLEPAPTPTPPPNQNSKSGTITSENIQNFLESDPDDDNDDPNDEDFILIEDEEEPAADKNDDSGYETPVEDHDNRTKKKVVTKKSNKMMKSKKKKKKKSEPWRIPEGTSYDTIGFLPALEGLKPKPWGGFRGGGSKDDKKKKLILPKPDPKLQYWASIQEWERKVKNHKPLDDLRIQHLRAAYIKVRTWENENLPGLVIRLMFPSKFISNSIRILKIYSTMSEAGVTEELSIKEENKLYDTDRRYKKKMKCVMLFFNFRFKSFLELCVAVYHHSDQIWGFRPSKPMYV